MKNTLRWKILGQEFEDGSKLTNWKKLEANFWYPQFESNYEMTFNIYEHDGQYWKLYQSRWVTEGSNEYVYRYGGQACRMIQVKYSMRSRSPHSGLLKQVGDLEWVRVYEVNKRIHYIVKVGSSDDKYGNDLVAI